MFGEFTGWCWRGGTLTPEEQAVYRPGLRFKHLGVATAHLGAPRDFPVLFRIYAHKATRSFPRERSLQFPEGSEFWVREIIHRKDGRICIGLEQRLPGIELLEGFDGAFVRWSMRLRTRLPAPFPGEIIESLEPFARWTWGADSGDPPLSGLLWDFDEAVKYTADYCGEPLPVVERIVEGRGRYLELAGLTTQTYTKSEWEHLHQERALYRAFLPEEPTFVDDREIDYLVLSTGLPRGQILRVVQGETAYQDHLGLIEWDDEAERCSALGLPMPEAMDPWSLLFARDWEGRVRHLDEVRLRGQRIGSFPASTEGHPRTEALWLPTGPDTGTFGLRCREGTLARLLTAYPLATSTAQEPLHLKACTPRSHGMEALVEVEDDQGVPIRALLPAPFRLEHSPGLMESLCGNFWMLGERMEQMPAGPSGRSIGLSSAGLLDSAITQFVGQVEASRPTRAWGRNVHRLALRIPWRRGDRLIPLWLVGDQGKGIEPGSWVSGSARLCMDLG